MSRKIIFVGVRGSGKTTCAKKVAKIMGWQFLDTDHIILLNFPGRTIGEVYKEFGEAKFRLMERDVIKNLESTHGNVVISTGGGVCMLEENRHVLQNLGRIFCVHIDKDALVERWKELPLFSAELTTFDEWYALRFDSFKKIEAEWIDPRKEDWVNKIVGVVHG